MVETNEEVEGGYLYVELLSELTEEQLKISQILLESLQLSLTGIVEEYPKYVKLAQ